MRLLLDTNILVFMSKYDWDGISTDVRGLLDDYSNILLTSTVCVHELIHLLQIGKVRPKKNDFLRNVGDTNSWLVQAGIQVVSVTMRHLDTLASLPLDANHRDPNDRLIIAQAITDRVPLVSSDAKFTRYAKNGLEFVYNMR